MPHTEKGPQGRLLSTNIKTNLSQTVPLQNLENANKIKCHKTNKNLRERQDSS